MSRVRYRVYYSGRVQGVGFRYTSSRLAHDQRVAGSVRNLPDGRVELVAEGDPTAVDALLAAIRSEMHAYIRDVHAVSETPDDPPLSEFSILH